MSQIGLPIDESDIGEGQQVQPVVLILDISYSMALPENDPPIKYLNEALPQFSDYLRSDDEAYDTVRIKIITAGGVVTETDFVRADDFNPEEYKANGHTPLGEAMIRAIDAVDDFRNTERAKGKKSLRPLIITVSDGAPNDQDKDVLASAIRRAHRVATDNKWEVLAIAVPTANVAALKNFSPTKDVLMLNSNINFQEMMSFVSEVVAEVYRSSTKDTPDLSDAIANHAGVDLAILPTGGSSVSVSTV